MLALKEELPTLGARKADKLVRAEVEAEVANTGLAQVPPPEVGAFGPEGPGADYWPALVDEFRSKLWERRPADAAGNGIDDHCTESYVDADRPLLRVPCPDHDGAEQRRH